MWNEMNVLIVDSNQKVLETLKSPLEGEGYKIDTATDGRSTIKIVEQGKFGVVILNINLPDINGIEVLKKIKNTTCYWLYSSPPMTPTNYIPNTGGYL